MEGDLSLLAGGVVVADHLLLTSTDSAVLLLLSRRYFEQTHEEVRKSRTQKKVALARCCDCVVRLFSLTSTANREPGRVRPVKVY